MLYKAEVEHPLEALKNQIRGWYASEPPELEITASGNEYTVILSPKAKERKITNIRKLARKMKDAFWAACTVPLGAIDRFFPKPEDRADLLAESQTGSRTVKAVRNPEAK